MALPHILPRIAFGLLLLSPCGCGSRPTVQAVPESHQNLRNISFAYAQATDSLGRGPLNKEELKPFLKKMGDPAEILRSPVDGQEFVIHWGLDYRKMKSGSPPVLA